MLIALQSISIAAVRTPPEHMWSLNTKHSHIADFLTIVRLRRMWHSFLFLPRYRFGNVDYLCPKIVENTRTSNSYLILFHRFTWVS